MKSVIIMRYLHKGRKITIAGHNFVLRNKILFCDANPCKLTINEFLDICNAVPDHVIFSIINQDSIYDSDKSVIDE